MRRARLIPALCVSLLVLSLALPASAGPAIGAAAPDFTLTAIDGSTFKLADALKSNKAVVLAFIATKCPYDAGYNQRKQELAKAYASKGVLFVGINSNKAELVDEMKAHASKYGHTFPILKDTGNKVADLYGAQRTPEVFVIDSKGMLRYHGRIDENYEDASKVQSPDLKNALEQLLAGQAISNAETKAFGCTIKRV
jgi:peroxiredoxin